MIIERNPIGALQEFCVARKWPHPYYETVAEEGPPHDRTFKLRVTVGEYQEIGDGKKKKIAKSLAASKMMKVLLTINKLPKGKVSFQERVATATLIWMLICFVSGWIQKKFFKFFLITAFIASLIFNWKVLYEKKLNERHLILAPGIPPECQEDPSFFTSLIQSFKANVFGDYGRNKVCEEYKKAIYSEPVWEVTPAIVFAETVTQTVLYPLEQFGTKLARFLGAIISEVGWMGSWVVLGISFILVIVTVLVMIVTILASYGYSVQVWPFIFLSPPHPYQNQLPDVDYCPPAPQMPDQVDRARSTIECLRAQGIDTHGD
ncbi:unnamed protein product [Darwinula stevensoni]|uniref:DRBM domain-containing protein n=1 Tax=Darwinula stevensoni TaxID=69355 RepID=A0A7R8X4D9_9CRUS|nr:unnamed protein product [Darwinula stevensoni]CAG0885507.1 unnamed protein product [Darwinula stevensoni]